LAEIGEHVVVILSTHIVEDVSDLCRAMAIIHHGQVLLTDEPAAAVGALRGKVWEKAIPKAELADHERRYRVLSTRLFAGRTRIRILSGEQPDPDFEPVAADVEDVYFATIQTRNGRDNGATAEGSVPS